MADLRLPVADGSLQCRRLDVVIAQFPSQPPGDGDEAERDSAFRSLAAAITTAGR